MSDALLVDARRVAARAPLATRRLRVDPRRAGGGGSSAPGSMGVGACRERRADVDPAVGRARRRGRGSSRGSTTTRTPWAISRPPRGSAISPPSARGPCASPSSASSTRARAPSSTRSSERTSRRPACCPTTATLHHLRWAPDPFAKILFVDGEEPRERIVALADLRAALRGIDPAIGPARGAAPAARVARERRDPRYARLQRPRSAPRPRRSLGVRGGRRRDLAPRRHAGDEAERARGARGGAPRSSCRCRCSSTRRTASAPRTSLG